MELGTATEKKNEGDQEEIKRKKLKRQCQKNLGKADWRDRRYYMLRCER